MKTHELKIIPEMFRELEEGDKTCEIRLNDRDYQKGDLLILRELVFGTENYTGSNRSYQITHILSGWGLKENYVCLSLKLIEVYNPTIPQRDPNDLPF